MIEPARTGARIVVDTFVTIDVRVKVMAHGGLEIEIDPADLLGAISTPSARDKIEDALARDDYTIGLWPDLPDPL